MANEDCFKHDTPGIFAVRAAPPSQRCCDRPAALLPYSAWFDAELRPEALRLTLSDDLPFSSYFEKNMVLYNMDPARMVPLNLDGSQI
jgi:hypothetical protein